MLKIIDTHAHFWNVEKLNYPWIVSGSPFDRNFLLKDYQIATKAIPIDKIVFVECDADPSRSFDEVDWIQEYSVQDPRIQGIVAHLHLVDTAMHEVDAKIERIASIPIAKGIRHNIQNTYPGFAIQKNFIEGVKKVHKRNLHFELCLTHDQLEDAITLVRKCPEGLFVLDHCAKPGIKAGLKEPWITHMKKMAAMENVICKISGLLTEADWNAWTEEEVLFYAKYAVTVFGMNRIIYGSDWPVNVVTGGYEKWFELMQSMTQTWSPSEQEDFYYNNAIKVYRLA